VLVFLCSLRKRARASRRHDASGRVIIASRVRFYFRLLNIAVAFGKGSAISKAHTMFRPEAYGQASTGVRLGRHDHSDSLATALASAIE
jgi:hypothetical protein